MPIRAAESGRFGRLLDRADGRIGLLPLI